MSAIEIASLFAVLEADDRLSDQLDKAEGKVVGLGKRIDRIGEQMVVAGGKITTLTEPLKNGLEYAVGAAMDFDKSMTNVQAVLNKTDEEMVSLNAQVLAMGTDSVAGPQAAAEAFYDIVGGVADASTHMAILKAAMKTSTAGAANLGSTTKALISVMNSYKFSADKASYASDVLTRTVGMGVGTMDEFASALPQVTGLANSLGISFEDLGSMTAYLTTQGNTASQATTQLGAMMASMLNPNATMIDALKELGFESGEAAIKQLGLVGAFEALAGTSTVAEKGMAKATGSLEALRGVTSLAGGDFLKFGENYKTGLEGATDAAEKIQLESVAAQFDLLKSQLAGTGIVIGAILLPMLNEVVPTVKPIIEKIGEWVQANPELSRTILMIAGGLVVLGPILMIAGMAVGLLSTAMGILLSPAVLLAGAIAAIVFAAQMGYPGGIAQLLSDAATSAQQLAIMGFAFLSASAVTVRMMIDIVVAAFDGFIGKLQDARKFIDELLEQNPALLQALFVVAIAAGILAATYGIMQVKILAVTGITWALAAAKSALAFAAWAAAAGVGGLSAAMAAAVLPIIAVAAAIGAALVALKAFEAGVAEGKATAQGFIATDPGQKNLTEEQLWQQTLKSTFAEHGENPFSYLLAQSLYAELLPSLQNGASRDSGGSGMAGETYLIGTGAQPELFTAPANGTFTANADKMVAPLIGQMIVYANDAAGGRAAGEAAWERLEELERARG